MSVNHETTSGLYSVYDLSIYTYGRFGFLENISQRDILNDIQ